MNRKISESIQGGFNYKYRYDGMSRLTEVIDVGEGKTRKYEYDILGRITAEKYLTGNELLSSLNIRYDDTKNRISGYTATVNGDSQKIDYVYSTDEVCPDLIGGVKLNDQNLLTYGYDYLNRLSNRTLTTPSGNYVTEYTYTQGETFTETSTLVGTMSYGGNTYYYTYDSMGNITSYTENEMYTETYVYDSLNQLVKANTEECVYEYFYDNGGNITEARVDGVTTKYYTYGNPQWKDQLTEFNGGTITYDNIGNPLVYHDGTEFTWNSGRRLTGVETNSGSYTYKYDSDGRRYGKINYDTFEFTVYYWLDGRLYQEERIMSGETTTYFYDENGSMVGFILDNGTTETTYYYVYNLQGAVTAIIDSNRNIVVEYTYDPWGKVLSITGTLASTIGQTNPIRYRGYYYDTETGFYYCQSRYYDPEIGRWINADGQLSTGQGILGYNMYAYCGNNPILYTDKFGDSPTISYGYTYDLGQGWKARFDYGVGAGNKNHVHVWRNETEWVMHLDGTISHENRSKSGTPPQ